LLAEAFNDGVFDSLSPAEWHPRMEQPPILFRHNVADFGAQCLEHLLRLNDGVTDDRGATAALKFLAVFVPAHPFGDGARRRFYVPDRPA
jgi:hypothetical protein